jgi:hypothetical protein
MATYIKIRELTPYAEATGVFSGDMLALSLDTTTANSPHSVQGTQRATVEQVIRSYNLQQASATAAEAGITPGELADPTTTLAPQVIVTEWDADTQECITTNDPPLTARTFASAVKLGGGLEYTPNVISTDVNGCKTYDYTLGFASSTSSTTFNLVVSGGATDAEHSITSNGWISGRFSTLKSATDWMNVNISTATEINFLIAGNVEEVAKPSYYNIGSDTIQTINYLAYSAYSLTYDQNHNIPDNNESRWVYGHTTYALNDIVQYTGGDGIVGDWNLYRATANLGLLAPEVDGVTQNGWERMTPAKTTGMAAVDPNGFLPNNPIFDYRPTITFTQASTDAGGFSYFWLAHAGETRFTHLKLIFKNVNPVGHQGVMRLIRKADPYFLSLAASEIHIKGNPLSQVFQLINKSKIRTYASAPMGLSSVPDPYNVTGAANAYAPLPGLYLSVSGSNIGSVVQAIDGTQALLGNDYWSTFGTFTLNETQELSRLQWGSGLNQLTTCVEALSTSQVGGNTAMAMCPGTTFAAGGVYLTTQAYSGAGFFGLGGAYPNFAPVAARQFISNNTIATWNSGHRPPLAGKTSPPNRWPGNVMTDLNGIASGDSFISSTVTAPLSSIDLPTYERYPDYLPAY